MDRQLGQTRVSDLWVFAYGSLMWKPGFAVAETARARIDGYRRHFCMWSIHHRGTVENPGLVLALDPEAGASCEGLGLRVAPHDADAVITYLRERELISSAYVEVETKITLADGRAVTALAYVMNQDHEQYTGALPLEDQAAIIARSTGGMGPNDEYLHATVSQLAAIGCPDAELERLSQLVQNRA